MSTPERLDFPDLTAPGSLPKIETIFDFSDKALNELKLWLEMHPLSIPIKQVLGFSQFTAKTASVDTAQNRTNAAYGNLTTNGPEILELPDGKYVIFHGCSLVTSIANAEVYQSVSVNGSTPTDADSVTSGVPNRSSVFTAVLADLNNGGNNSVKTQYRCDGGATLTAAKRKIIVVKYDNV